MIYKALTVMLILAVQLMAQVSQAAPVRFDFEFQITQLSSTGDTSMIPDINSGLLVGDTATGFFTIDVAQVLSSDYWLSDLSPSEFLLAEVNLSLPSGDAFGLLPAPGFTILSGGRLRHGSVIDPGFNISYSLSNPSVQALGVQFSIQGIRLLAESAIYADKYSLDPYEIKSNLQGSTFSYVFGQVEYVPFMFGLLGTSAIGSNEFNADITSVSFSIPSVPLPTAGPLLMSALGLLAMFKRRRINSKRS